MVFINNNTFKHWLDVYENADHCPDISVTNSNTKHLLTCTASKNANNVIKTHISFPFSAIIIGSLQDGNVNLHIIHHLFKLVPPGISFDSEEHTAYGIQGIEEDTKVVEIHEDFFIDVPGPKMSTPNLSSFMQAEGNMEAIENLSATLINDSEIEDHEEEDENGHPFPLFSPRLATSIPPFLVPAFGNNTPTEPLGALIEAISTIESYAKEFDVENETKVWISTYPILQSLWLLHQSNQLGHGPNLTHPHNLPSESINESAIKTSKAFESIFISQPPPPQVPTIAAPAPAPATTGNFPTDPNLTAILNSQAETMCKLVDMIDSNTAPRGEGSATNYKKRLNIKLRTSLLIASSSTTSLAPTELNEDFRLLLESPKGQALHLIQFYITQSRGGSQTIDISTSTMFFNCAFLNTRRDHPNGLSTFFCVPSPILGGESLMSSEELELRKVTHNLSNSEIQKVLTSQIMLPKDGYALKATIENLLCLIDFAFTSESLFYKGIESILSAMTKNPTTFNTMATKDKSFIPKLMWKIDVKMHRFLESCTKAQKISDVNFQAINFSKEIDSILDSEQINIILPDSVSKIAFQTPDHQKRNRPSIDSEDTKRSSKRPTTNPATKDSNNSPWKRSKQAKT